MLELFLLSLQISQHEVHGIHLTKSQTLQENRFVISVSTSKAPFSTELLPAFLAIISMKIAREAEEQINGCYKGANVKVHAIQASGEAFELAQAAQTVQQYKHGNEEAQPAERVGSEAYERSVKALLQAWTSSGNVPLDRAKYVALMAGKSSRCRTTFNLKLADAASYAAVLSIAPQGIRVAVEIALIGTTSTSFGGYIFPGSTWRVYLAAMLHTLLNHSPNPTTGSDSVRSIMARHENNDTEAYLTAIFTTDRKSIRQWLQQPIIPKAINLVQPQDTPSSAAEARAMAASFEVPYTPFPHPVHSLCRRAQISFSVCRLSTMVHS